MSSVLLFTLLLCSLGMVASESSCCGGSLRCPHSWTWYDHQCYQFNFDAKAWASAEDFCNRAGGHLASYHSQSQYEFLRKLIYDAAGTHKPTWVGAHDAVKEGQWMWSDGSFFDFTNWGSGEPNNSGGNEDCMMINLRDTDYVNDATCEQTRPFVCSRGLL